VYFPTWHMQGPLIRTLVAFQTKRVPPCSPSAPPPRPDSRTPPTRAASLPPPGPAPPPPRRSRLAGSIVSQFGCQEEKRVLVPRSRMASSRSRSTSCVSASTPEAGSRVGAWRRVGPALAGRVMEVRGLGVEAAAALLHLVAAGDPRVAHGHGNRDGSPERRSAMYAWSTPVGTTHGA
jgi:hypothetical protein